MSDTKVDTAKDTGAENDSVTLEKKDATPTGKKKGPPKRNWQKVDLQQYYEPPPVGKGEHNVDRNAQRKKEDDIRNIPQKGEGRTGYDEEGGGKKGKGGGKGKGYEGVQAHGKGKKGKSEEVRSEVPAAAPVAAPIPAAQIPVQSFDNAVKSNPKGSDATASKGQQHVPAQAQGIKGMRKGKDKGKGKDKSNGVYNHPRKGKASWEGKDAQPAAIPNASAPQHQRNKGQASNQGYYMQPAAVMQPQNVYYYPYPAYYVMSGQSSMPQVPVQAIPAQALPMGMYQPNLPVGQLGDPAVGGHSIMHQILLQVEYYFGIENLSKPDLFLRKQMDAEGFVSIGKLLDFYRMKRFAVDVSTVVNALNNSSVVELDSTKAKVRRRNDWLQWIIMGDGSPHSSEPFQHLAPQGSVDHDPEPTDFAG